jgi:hypothetical protein
MVFASYMYFELFNFDIYVRSTCLLDALFNYFWENVGINYQLSSIIFASVVTLCADRWPFPVKEDNDSLTKNKYKISVSNPTDKVHR